MFENYQRISENYFEFRVSFTVKENILTLEHMEGSSCKECVDDEMKVLHWWFQSCWTLEVSHSDHLRTGFPDQKLLSPTGIQSHVWNKEELVSILEITSEIMEAAVIKQLIKEEG